MATDGRYPGASSRLKRGKVIWRYREPGISGRETVLPGIPGSDEFDAAYHGLVAKRGPADLIDLPGRALPRSFGKAAMLLEGRNWWADYDPKTQAYNLKFIERFLQMKVDPSAPLLWREVPVDALKRSKLNEIIMAIYVETAHTARHFFNAFKKLIRVAIEEKWIEPEDDPTLSIKLKKPKHIGSSAWPEDAMAKFEARHPIGSSARTAYEIAKWIGNRRGDIANLSWDSLKTIEVVNDEGDFEFLDCFEFHQRKNQKRTGGKHMVLPVTSKLAGALSALKRQPGKTVLQRFDGEPYSEKSLTGSMAKWTAQADIPPGHTLHGLRKSFAHYLKKTNANLAAIRDAMGHTTLSVTQIYLEGMNQEDNALQIRGLINEREAKRDNAKRRANLRIVG